MKDNKHNERIYYNENGMIIPHSEKAEHIIWELEYEMNHPRHSGYTGSDMKKRLWDIKMRVDKAIAKCSCVSSVILTTNKNFI